MKNKIILTLIILCIFNNTQAQISANVTLTTDYVWRGISQNGEDLAIQGGFDYNHESGFYIGTWASNVSFSGASTELDVYLGWSNEFESGLGLDVGLLQYSYHGSNIASDNNFKELYLGLSHSGFNLLYSFGDEFDDQWEFGYEHDIKSITLSTTLGDYTAYRYFKIGISGEVAKIGWSLDFWKTDSDGENLFGDLADDRFVFSITKEF